jgi:NDP-sugar pyrophosphorylase family protein
LFGTENDADGRGSFALKAMILAAGLGTRLRPLTNTIPKPLLPVGGTPLIVWNLLLLRRHGIREVIVNLHHLGHLIRKELGDGSTWGMRISYSEEPTLLGTGGGLKQAEAFFAGEPFLVMINGRGRTYHGPVVKRMFAGVHIVHPRLLRTVPVGHKSSIIDAYVREIEQGECVCGYSLHGYWSDVGTSQRYGEAQNDVERGLIRLADRMASIA